MVVWVFIFLKVSVTSDRLQSTSSSISGQQILNEHSERQGKFKDEEASRTSSANYDRGKENCAGQPSKAVLRALEHQRKQQQSPGLLSSPPLKQARERLRSGPRSQENEYSVKVTRWRMRGQQDGESGHDDGCRLSADEVALERQSSFASDESSISAGQSINYTPMQAVEGESDENGVAEVEFAIEVYKYKNMSMTDGQEWIAGLCECVFCEYEGRVTSR